ncbi:MAG: sigma-70 family RNA polymerase sigma factor [Planctomycetota bacterium]
MKGNTSHSGSAAALEKLAGCATTQRALRRIARGLVGDVHAAEDMVQSAYLSALIRPPRALSFAWLRQTLTTKAIDRLRRRGNAVGPLDGAEHALEDDRHGPTELLESIEAYQTLGEAIGTLPQEQAEALYLRYFEDLPPAAMARRLGIPVETVKSRLARGLKALRLRLEADGRQQSGDAASLLHAVALVAGVPTRGVTTSPLVTPASAISALRVPLATLIMKNSTTLAAALILACLAGLGGLWRLGANAMTESGTALPAAPETLVRNADEATATPLSQARPADRENASRASNTASGDGGTSNSPEPGVAILRARVTWFDDTPAAGTQVAFVREDAGNVRTLVGEATVDARGIAQVKARSNGRFRLFSSVRGEATAMAEVGKTAEAAIAIPDGVDVEGVVRAPDGRPMPGADVWLSKVTSGWKTHARAAVTDERGSFRLRDAPVFALVSASCDGYGVSTREAVWKNQMGEAAGTLDRVASVDLTLAPQGASVRGIVLGMDGQPISDAQVAVTSVSLGTVMEPESRGIETRYLKTDQDGRFSTSGLNPGEVSLQAASPGLAHARASRKVGGGATWIHDFDLGPGATFSGRVTDDAGNAVEGACIFTSAEPIGRGAVSAPGWPVELPLGFPRAVSGPDGSYVLPSIPPGHVYAYCAGRQIPKSVSGNRLVAELECSVTAGEKRNWSPRLGEGPTIRGTVRFANGEPMKNQYVLLTDDGSDEHRFAVTDESGRFRVHNLAADSYLVCAAVPDGNESPEVITLHGVIPDGPDVELVASRALPLEPSQPAGAGSIACRLHDPYGRLSGRTVCILEDASGAQVQQLMAEADRPFLFESLAEGDYRIRVRGGGLHTLYRTDLIVIEENGTADLGSITLPKPGGQRLHYLRDPDWPAMDGFLLVNSLDGTCRVSDFIRAGESTRLLDNLNPGRYRVTVHEGNIVEVGADFEVVEGEIGDVDLPLVVGVHLRVTIRFRPSLYGDGTRSPVAPVTLRYLSASGDLLAMRELKPAWFALGEAETGTCLPKGTVTIEASHPVAGRDTTTVFLKEIGGEAPAVTLDLSR